MKTTATHVYFYGMKEIYSNWNRATFIHNGITFQNSEQAFMWEKANFFKDEVMRDKIAQEFNPKEAKALGRFVAGYNDDKWNAVRYQYMVSVNVSKFRQNPFYMLTLLNTDKRILVEASPYDKIWGVGLGENDNLILDEKNWLGKNLLGKALIDVRFTLKLENSNIKIPFKI